ncbi:MAG: SDR family NAD(P)-dependent oxidoreductase [Planctomycetota bacterium]|jgi:short-subunit dehydrogenase|nr:SDR family NAD(P)-dependent oxidoreductase [Planctomycetota bacterium]
MHPRNKTVWITGASSGIGRALAMHMARSGANLLLSARRLDMLRAAAEECREHGGRVSILPFDLAETGMLRGIAAEAEARVGPVDILAAIGGVGQRGLALETDLAVARKIMDVDFWGAVELTRAVAPGMIKRGQGQIVMLSGVLGKFGAPRRSFYAASKHALHGWFESLREETLGTGLEITLLVPGWVRTEISEKALEADGVPHGKLDAGQAAGISPDECARRAMPAIIKGVPEQLIGGIECGGVYLNRLWPGLFKWFLRRRGIG